MNACLVSYSLEESNYTIPCLLSFFSIASSMKQKIVLEINLNGEKYRSKAFKIAGEEQGVTSVSMDEDNKMVVIGNNLKTICLFNHLIKKFPSMKVLSVEEVKPPPPPAPVVTTENNKETKKTCCAINKDDCAKVHGETVIVCSKCRSSKCDGNCGDHNQGPPWCTCPRCYYVPYRPSYCYDPFVCNFVFDSYSDWWSIN